MNEFIEKMRKEKETACKEGKLITKKDGYIRNERRAIQLPKAK